MSDYINDLEAEEAERARAASLRLLKHSTALECLRTHYGESETQEYPDRLIAAVVMAYDKGEQSHHERISRIASDCLRYKQALDATTDQLKKTQEFLELLQVFEKRLPMELRPMLQNFADPEWDIPF